MKGKDAPHASDGPSPASTGPASTGPTCHTGRRRFLGGLGGSGLAVAAVIFGRAQGADAAVLALHHVGCCELSYANSGRSSCYSGNHYVWTCGEVINGTLDQCDCCEHYNPNYSTANCVVSP